MASPTNLKAALLKKRERRPSCNSTNALSSGSTLLNLAISDHPNCGFTKGGYFYFVGDSTSGKTWLSLTCFAESTLNKDFKDYRLIFDDVEGGALMNIEDYFGAGVAKRMETPQKDPKKPLCSETVEDFYYNITDAIEAEKPFIYVLDSQDALGSKAAGKKFAEHKKAAQTGKEEPGSYGDGKAKYHSEHIREVLAGLRRTKSILIIIGQTRDNLGFGFEKKTRSGGKALRFYANVELWSSVGFKIKKKVRGKDRTIGANCIIEIKKNRVTGKTGKDRAVTVPIYYDLGIDDVGSCVDFLIAEGHWQKPTKGQTITADDIDFKGTRPRLIQFIEDEDLEMRVRKITGRVWREIEEESKVKRKKRYS